MDDDLMSLRSGKDKSSEDDFFSSFDAPSPAPSAAAGTSSLDLGLEGFGATAAEPAKAAAKKAKAPAKKKAKRRKRGRPFLGMTPAQRMFLSIFLFLDVSMLGFLILFALGAINLF